ncbi:MAG: hypothetical protein HQK97_04445 [Nitrospirae bacterium]|nr:hypothetical protein [Nitrospirota bacterium]
MDTVTKFDPIKSYESEFFDMFDELVTEAAELSENTGVENSLRWYSMILKLLALLAMAVKIGKKHEVIGGIHDTRRN